ncbi:MAG: response regulator [Desulfobulbaceae bacterium]|nr:response regulator [Desulfobulbaceae bacterium]
MRTKEHVRILVAEDNIVTRETIKRSLQEIGFELVGMAATGLDAVNLALSLRPDVILMDIEMPELNGLEATLQIRQKFSVPVVVLTSHEGEDFVEKASKVGVSAYLIKPLKTKDIERAIIMAMARHDDMMKCWRLNRELEQALKEIKTLRGILPLCSYCKKIRDDKGYWEQVDVYIRKYSGADVSHSLCPDCRNKYYPDLAFPDD